MEDSQQIFFKTLSCSSEKQKIMDDEHHFSCARFKYSCFRATSETGTLGEKSQNLGIERDLLKVLVLGTNWGTIYGKRLGGV